jgi:hypothetical protein
VHAAKSNGRIRMIDEDGDISDPYFGDERDYSTVCKHIMNEVPRSLRTILLEKGFIGVSGSNGVNGGDSLVGARGVSNDEWSIAGRVAGEEQRRHMEEVQNERFAADRFKKK